MPVSVVAVPVTIVAMPVTVIAVVVVASAVPAMVLVLAIVVPVIVAEFVVVFVAAEVILPPAMTAPVGMLATSRERPSITEARIVIVVDVPTEANRSMEPRAGTDKDAANKPLRSVITEWRALVGGVVEVAVWANRRYSNADRDLCRALLGSRDEAEGCNSRQNQIPENFHRHTPSGQTLS